MVLSLLAYWEMKRAATRSFDRPANGGNLLYTDYATKSHIYLSNQINSDHNNESDTSYLESTIGGCYLALSDDYLLFSN